jgi:ketosteroid isomerase-like protein
MTQLSARYHAAVLAKDVEAILAEMTDTIHMHSPTKMKPFEGKDIVRFLFGHLMEVLQDFRFGKIVETGDTAVLFFTCRIGGRDAEGCDVLAFTADGKINDFRVLIRPLRAVEALNEEMGKRLMGFGGNSANRI